MVLLTSAMMLVIVRTVNKEGFFFSTLKPGKPRSRKIFFVVKSGNLGCKTVRSTLPNC